MVRIDICSHFYCCSLSFSLIITIFFFLVFNVQNTVVNMCLDFWGRSLVISMQNIWLLRRMFKFSIDMPAKKKTLSKYSILNGMLKKMKWKKKHHINGNNFKPCQKWDRRNGLKIAAYCKTFYKQNQMNRFKLIFMTSGRGFRFFFSKKIAFSIWISKRDKLTISSVLSWRFHITYLIMISQVLSVTHSISVECYRAGYFSKTTWHSDSWFFPSCEFFFPSIFSLHCFRVNTQKYETNIIISNIYYPACEHTFTDMGVTIHIENARINRIDAICKLMLPELGLHTNLCGLHCGLFIAREMIMI